MWFKTFTFISGAKGCFIVVSAKILLADYLTFHIELLKLGSNRLRSSYFTSLRYTFLYCIEIWPGVNDFGLDCRAVRFV